MIAVKLKQVANKSPNALICLFAQFNISDGHGTPIVSLKMPSNLTSMPGKELSTEPQKWGQAGRDKVGTMGIRNSSLETLLHHLHWSHAKSNGFHSLPGEQFYTLTWHMV